MCHYSTSCIRWAIGLYAPDGLSRPTLAFVSHLRITGLDCHLDHLYEIFPRILARAVELGIDIWFGSELWSLLGANP